VHITPAGEQNLEVPVEITRPAQQPGRILSALILLSGCIALLTTGFGIIIPVFPQRLEALGLGAETLALMEMAFGLGMFLFSTPMGIMADRSGRKIVILLSMGGFIVTNIILVIVNDPFLFIVVRFIEGALVAGLMPASTAIVADCMPAEKQGRWIGFITTAHATGIALGPGLGGFLYEAWGFASPFLISAGVALGASLLVLILIPETLPAHVREQARQRRNSSLEQKQKKEAIWRQPGFLWLFGSLLFIDFGVTFIYPFVLPQFPFFFENELHFSQSQYGLIISGYGLALATFPMLLGGLTERVSKKALIVTGSILLLAMNLALLVFTQFWSLMIATIITGMGSSLIIPALSMIYLNTTTEENRSRIMGLRGTAVSLGILVGPLAQALAGPWITPRTSFAIGVGINVVITLIILIMLRESAPEADSAKEQPAV
jgi:predicted MFS family arabinose efflux permease